MIETLFMGLDEACKGTIPGFFHVIRETASRELFHVQMILKAFTADAMPWASRVGAVASLIVLLFIHAFVAHFTPPD